MNVVTDLLQIVGEWITGVFGWVGSAFTGVIEIFYDTAEGGGFTVLGALLLLGLASGLVFFALKYIRGLIAK